MASGASAVVISAPLGTLLMSTSASRPERIDLRKAEDPRDVIHQAVACLAQGGIVALPTDTTYSLAASALQPRAVARLTAIKGLPGPRPMPLALKSAEEIRDWAPNISLTGRRLARRSWPGPVTLLAQGGVERGLVRRLPPEVAHIVAPADVIGLRCPASAIVLDILQLMPGPLVLTGAKHAGARSRVAPDSLDDIPELDLILDDGPPPETAGSTVVRIEGDSWIIERPGLVDRDVLNRRSGTILLFVCTGNTCRSPMAEALCRLLLARRLGCSTSEVESRGFTVLSAGISATDGMPAAPHAVKIVRDRGGSLDDHASQPIRDDLIHQADWVLALTRSHHDALLAHFPEAADRVRLLHAQGQDIDDPVGADLATYRETAEAIETHLEHLLDSLGTDAPSASRSGP